LAMRVSYSQKPEQATGSLAFIDARVGSDR
jgi:hypothetical protein